MAPNPTGLSLSAVLLCVVYLTYGLMVHCLSCLSSWLNSSCWHVWSKILDAVMYPFASAATALQQLYDISASACRSRWQAFSSLCTTLKSFAPGVIVATIGARVSDSISTFAKSASDLCRNAEHVVKQACAYALCTALLSLVHAFVGTFGYPLVRLSCSALLSQKTWRAL